MQSGLAQIFDYNLSTTCRTAGKGMSLASSTHTDQNGVFSDCCIWLETGCKWRSHLSETTPAAEPRSVRPPFRTSHWHGHGGHARTATRMGTVTQRAQGEKAAHNLAGGESHRNSRRQGLCNFGKSPDAIARLPKVLMCISCFLQMTRVVIHCAQNGSPANNQ